MTAQIRTTRFWLAWIVASLLVYPLVIAFALAFSMIWFPTVEALFPAFEEVTFTTTATTHVMTLLTLVGFGGIIALAVGVLQANVIKRYFHFEMQYWKRATVIGGFIAAPVTAFALFAMHDYMNANYWQLFETGQFEAYNTLINILPMVMYVTVMSVVQVVVLRQYVRHAWLWILANAVAGLMFSMLATVTFRPGVVDWLLAAIAQGAITGFAMLFLLHRLTDEGDDDDGGTPEYAYQHVPIDIDD